MCNCVWMHIEKKKGYMRPTPTCSVLISCNLESRCLSASPSRIIRCGLVKSSQQVIRWLREGCPPPEWLFASSRSHSPHARVTVNHWLLMNNDPHCSLALCSRWSRLINAPFNRLNEQLSICQLVLRAWLPVRARWPFLLQRRAVFFYTWWIWRRT